jgi:hypothetical protein
MENGPASPGPAAGASSVRSSSSQQRTACRHATGQYLAPETGLRSHERASSAHSLSFQYIAAEPRWLSWYSDCLRAERLKVRSSSPGKVKHFHITVSTRQAMGSTQTPLQWVPGA